MAEAQSYHPGLFSDSTMFIDDDCRFASSTAYLTDHIVSKVDVAKAVAKLGDKLGRFKAVSARRVGKPDEKSRGLDLVLHIEPAAPALAWEYSEYLKMHVVDFTNAPFHANLQSQLKTLVLKYHCDYGAVESYLPSIGISPVAQTNCDSDDYYRPFIERVRGFRDVEFASDDDSVPASAETVDEVLRFIDRVPMDVRRPGAALGADGSIALVWQDEENYITAVFYGTGTYSYVVRRQKRTIAAASSGVDSLPAELSDPVRQFFRRV